MVPVIYRSVINRDVDQSGLQPVVRGFLGPGKGQSFQGISKSVLVFTSCSCCNKWPQTQWLHIAQIYYFCHSGGPKSEMCLFGLKSRCWRDPIFLEALGERPFLAPAASSGHPALRLMVPPSMFKVNSDHSCVSHAASLDLLSFPVVADLSDPMGATWII